MTESSNSHVRTVKVGVLVQKERLDSPWQPFRWRVAAAWYEPAEGPGGGGPGGSVSREGPDAAEREGAELVDCGVHDAELHRKETAAYKLNLESGAPAVYVVLAEAADGGDGAPVSVTLVTLSPDEAQAYGTSGFEVVEQVAMPAELVPIVAHFIAEHHVEERFVKRQRVRAQAPEELFGQEPIFNQRGGRRGGARGTSGGADEEPDSTS